MDEIKEDYNLVTYTYDEWDRILYKNVYKTDVPYRSAIDATGNNIQNLVASNKRPKQLLYQDVYTYKEGIRRVAPAIRRVYQPIIDFTATRESNTITLKGSFMCKSKVLASGFIWSTSDSDSTIAEAMVPPNYFKGEVRLPRQVYTGANALGTKIHTINSGSTHYVKAFVQIETGTLFSKTITV